MALSHRGSWTRHRCDAPPRYPGGGGGHKDRTPPPQGVVIKYQARDIHLVSMISASPALVSRGIVIISASISAPRSILPRDAVPRRNDSTLSSLGPAEWVHEGRGNDTRSSALPFETVALRFGTIPRGRPRHSRTCASMRPDKGVFLPRDQWWMYLMKSQ